MVIIAWLFSTVQHIPVKEWEDIVLSYDNMCHVNGMKVVLNIVCHVNGMKVVLNIV